jgi:hypothetical protein
MDQNILTNALLVHHNLRPSFLIQPIDYGEFFEKRDKTNKILDMIKLKYPNLHHTECNQGILISKQSYTSAIFYTDERLGEILGYPSAKDFEYILNNPDEPSATISVSVYNVNCIPVQILANRCKIENISRDKQYFENIATEFAKITDSDNRLIIKVDITIPIKSIINKLFNNNTLNENEKFEVNNSIWNLGMEKLNEYPFDYTNHIHKGIVLTLLSYCNNTTLSPFYPLQNYPTEMEKVNKITEKWEQEMLKILDSTT